MDRFFPRIKGALWGSQVWSLRVGHLDGQFSLITLTGLWLFARAGRWLNGQVRTNAAIAPIESSANREIVMGAFGWEMTRQQPILLTFEMALHSEPIKSEPSGHVAGTIATVRNEASGVRWIAVASGSPISTTILRTIRTWCCCGAFIRSCGCRIAACPTGSAGSDGYTGRRSSTGGTFCWR